MNNQNVIKTVAVMGASVLGLKLAIGFAEKGYKVS